MSSMVPKDRLKHLFDQGGNVSVDKNVPIQRYYRSGQEMMRMANIYYEEKQYESAYLLFAKFITLFLEKMKIHPQLNQVPPVPKAANKKSLKIALTTAEKIKVILEEKYEIEYLKWKTEQDRMKEIEKRKIEEEKRKEKEQKELEERAMLDKEKQQLDYFVEQQRRKQLEDERLAIEARFSDSTKLEENKSFPLIPVDFAPPPPTYQQQETDYQPPSYQQSVSHVPKIQPPPTVDRSVKPQYLIQPDPHVPPTQGNGSTVANNISSNKYTGAAISSTTTTSKNKYGLRTVISPRDLPQKFMQYAKSNTMNNIETCGVLFGNLSQNMFVITHVLLPQQTGTSDSCTTSNEEDLWEFQAQYDGICLGWIHTHPSQTAFLSSVDLHTHYPYQCLMAESVAIVCSGKFNETGYFMLTPGQGMKEIGNCSKPGHHPHQTNPPLFQSCDHVQVSDSHQVEFMDWRKR
ncbi:STAM-binding protein-like [Styela clava]